MRRSKIVALLLLTCSGLTALLEPLEAQIPLGEEFKISQKIELFQAEQEVAVGTGGEFAVTWNDLWDFGAPGAYSSFLAVRFYDAGGAALTETVYPEGTPGLRKGESLSSLIFLQKSGSGYRFLSRPLDSQSITRLWTYSASGISQRAPIDIPLPDGQGSVITSLAMAPSGRLAVAWVRIYPEPARAAWLAPSGQFSPSFFEGVTPDGHVLPIARLGVDGGGNTVVVGTDCLRPQGRDCDIYAQRFNRLGHVLGRTFRVNEGADGSATSIAVARDGRFLVAWHQSERAFPDNPFALDTLARVFDPFGRPLTGELRIGTQRNFSDISPHASVDPHGNFILVYSRFRRENGIYGWDVMGQLIRKDGKRVGAPFRVSTNNTLNEFTHPKVAFGGNGTFVVVWEAFDGDFDGVFGQRFLAAEGEEICAVEGAELWCDGARSGGAAEWTVGLGGGQAVLGDVDRDGKEDVCVFTRGEFRCDTDHRGLPSETTLRFGRDGDVALWGDVDGDGRGEACVRRGTLISCDTGHNGGRGELNVQMGNAADLPLLADVNGDRREDACVYQAAGRFACVLSGSGKSWSVSFGGQAGDVAALGDFNGDGKADPCVWRQGELLCDTARNGGAPEARLAMPEPGGRLLFANVDGL